MTDATHTRESVIEECATELERLILPSMPDYLKAHIQADVDYLRGLKSISTPIPLTPSDEMVDAALLDYHGPMAWGTLPPIILQSAKSRMKSALQAALNLMGGKK